MAKAKKKYEIPQTNYLKNSNFHFCLVAFPAPLIVDIDVVRDAIITYIPGYDEEDFLVLRQFLEWIDNIEDTICQEHDSK